jgi:hypothetical protein
MAGLFTNLRSREKCGNLPILSDHVLQDISIGVMADVTTTMEAEISHTGPGRKHPRMLLIALHDLLPPLYSLHPDYLDAVRFP